LSTAPLSIVGSDPLALETALAQRLDERSANNPDYWSFRHLGPRPGSHGFFQYPAMMVPELQGALLDDAIAVDPTIRTVYDPFTGSGTVLVEAAHRGLNFHGTDINPMAVLLSQVKSAPPTVETAEFGLKQLYALREPGLVTPRSFLHSEKWFHQEVSSRLTALRTAIQKLESLRLRQYFWVCLAETVRLVSNSRISTFKLHTYPKDVLETRVPKVDEVFDRVCSLNLQRLESHWEARSSAPEVAVGADAPWSVVLQGSVMEPWPAPRKQKADLLMTSPPYGDNKTTVPYGQHSYLPLQWIDTADIPGGFQQSLLESTSRIDTLSLGGSTRKSDQLTEELRAVSESLAQFLTLLGDRTTLRRKVIAFVHDYRQGLTEASTRLRSGGFSFITLGERRVGGEKFPLVEITREILISAGHNEVSLLTRVLPQGRKRIAVRNSEGETMAKEFILVTRNR